MENVKILLTSDLHLGIERINPLISREERFNTFKKIISLASEHDILLLAGDIINTGLIDSQYISAINNELDNASVSGTEIFLAPGTGEIEKQNYISDKNTEFKTTHSFSNKNKDVIVKSEKGDIFIYGIPDINSAFPSDITRKEKKGFHIGLFYADFSPQSIEKKAAGCIGKKEIKNMNLDFFALGKNHSFRLFRFSERILGAYPGSPEPCSLDECGERFVISIEIEDSRISSFKRIPVNTVTVNSHEIDCSTISSEKELISSIKKSGNRDTMNRIELCGSRNFAAGHILKEELTGYYRGLKVIDRTLLSQSAFMEESASGNGFKGMFFRNLSQSIKMNPHLNPDFNLIKELFSVSGNETGGVLFCDS